MLKYKLCLEKSLVNKKAEKIPAWLALVLVICIKNILTARPRNASIVAIPINLMAAAIAAVNKC